MMIIHLKKHFLLIQKTSSVILFVFCFWCIVQVSTARAEEDVAQWTSRLEALQPNNPLAYFELAEEIADVAETADQRALAKHLFALAGALDPPQLGRSAALALADIEPNPQEKQRFLALALLLNDGLMNRADQFDKKQPSREQVLAVCEVLSLYRLGRGQQALALIERHDLADILQQQSVLLPGGYNMFLEACRTHHNRFPPKVGEAALTRMLQLEAALLAGEERSWSSDLLFHNAAPLLEVDPGEPETAFGVDPSRNLYRDGKWVR